jgi:hypothetical protein
VVAPRRLPDAAALAERSAGRPAQAGRPRMRRESREHPPRRSAVRPALSPPPRSRGASGFDCSDDQRRQRVASVNLSGPVANLGAAGGAST